MWRALSCLASRPSPQGVPRGLVFALHGGGSRAAYFHSPVDPSGVAPRDRGGPRMASRGTGPADTGRRGGDASPGLDVPKQANLLRQAITQLRGSEPLPVVLVGHSLGAVTALHLAKLFDETRDGNELVALALGGVLAGLHRRPVGRDASHGHDQHSGAAPAGSAPDPGNRPGPAGTWPQTLLGELKTVVWPGPVRGVRGRATAPPHRTEATQRDDRAGPGRRTGVRDHDGVGSNRPRRGSARRWRAWATRKSSW